jgi:hypothetical protein
MQVTATARPLTPKQQTYLADLLAKIADPEHQANLRHMLNDLYTQRLLTPAEASRQIDTLRGIVATQPRYVAPVVRNDIPVGRYAVENAEGVLAFYRVRKDGTLVVMASDVEHRVFGKAAAAVLDKIAEAGIDAAGRRFGQEIGSCYVCGRTLTDKDSRAKGIGPTCEMK